MGVAFSLAAMLKMHLIGNAIFQENEPMTLTSFTLVKILHVFDISSETLVLFPKKKLFLAVWVLQYGIAHIFPGI